MVLIYPVIFTATHDEKDTYLIEIPDINGMTEGYGLADAYHMAKDYIGCKFLEVKDDDIAPASDITSLDASKGMFAEAGDSFVSLVDLDLDAYRRATNNKAVRRNVSIPSWLNKAADDAGINVSRVLQEALMEKLQIEQ